MIDIRSVMNASGWTSFGQMVKRTGLPAPIVAAHVSHLLYLGRIFRFRKGLYRLPARPTLKPQPTPRERKLLSKFEPGRWSGYWQLAEAMDLIDPTTPRSSRVTVGLGLGYLLTRLVRRGLIVRVKRGTYILTEAGERLKGEQCQSTSPIP